MLRLDRCPLDAELATIAVRALSVVSQYRFQSGIWRSRCLLICLISQRKTHRATALTYTRRRQLTRTQHDGRLRYADLLWYVAGDDSVRIL